MIIDAAVSADWRNMVSEWLVEKGCLYMMAHGDECSLWDDNVDTANLEAFDWKRTPYDKFVTTTWHDDESLEEAFNFTISSALPFSPLIKNSVILDITDMPRELEMLARYKPVQSEADTDRAELSILSQKASETASDALSQLLKFIMMTFIIGIITFAVWVFIKSS